MRLRNPNPNPKPKPPTFLNNDFEAIYSEIDGFYNGFFLWVEQILAKWSEKTQIFSDNLSKTGRKNLLHTPIGQVNKMIENFLKLQQQGFENLEKDYDKDIFYDSDLFQELMRGSLEEKGEMINNEENT